MNETKILVIDDSKEILFAISTICEYEKWTAITACDGFEGIKMFKKFKPNLVLVDYHMPKMDGVETVRALREISRTVPIVVLTVEEKQEVADRFMLTGASDFALKPIKALDLIARIKVHLRIQYNHTVTHAVEEEYIKGINQGTLEIIIEDLMNRQEYTTLSKISQRTGLAYQTVHRYIQYLVEIKRVEVQLDYGKVGRPKQRYSWIG